MNVTWNVMTTNPLTKTMTKSRLQGHEILSLHAKNYTIKVFEKLHSSLKRKHMSPYKVQKLKIDLLKEYGHPKPFPTDRFLKLPSGSPDQAYVILGQKGTGRLEYQFR